MVCYSFICPKSGTGAVLNTWFRLRKLHSSFLFIMADNADYEIAMALEQADPDPQLQIPPELPLLPLRDIVIYPFMIVPLFVSRERSIRAVDEALGEQRMILLDCQKDLDKEEPQQGDLYGVGTVAVIMRMLKLPDGRIRIDRKSVV